MAKEKSLSQRLNDINFSNSQIPLVTNLQEGKKKMGRGSKRTQSSTKIQGLQTLKNTLGTQYMKK
jgi:hypothetical protein